MSEWERVRLGQVVALDIEAVEVEGATQYPIIGVLNRGRGLLYREPMSGVDTSYKTLNRIRPGQIVYSRLKAFEGAITVAPLNLIEGYASQEFPTFTCGPDLLPDFFKLVTASPRLWDDLQNLSTGMGGRRERVKPRDFLTISISLPPVCEQRHIVDVLAAVDAQIEALEAEVLEIQQAQVAVRDALLLVPDWPVIRLIDITTKIGSGATPKGGESAYVDEGIALVRSQNVHNLQFVWDGLARITDAQAQLLAVVALEMEDVLINITGASVNRVCVVPGEALPARVNQHVAILRCDRALIAPRFLAQLLRRSDLKARLDLIAQSGSTRQAITKAQLEAFEVPVPSLEEQERLLAALDSQVSQARSLTVELTTLHKFRANLLTALLNQEISIPESYDGLLVVAS